MVRAAVWLLAAWWAAGSQARAQSVNEFPLPGTGLPEDMAAGADGNLWFTELTNAIGRITTFGVVTEFPVPTSGSSPQGIAAGPDGALWFTEYGAGKIGRVTTAGAFTEYPVPTASSGA
jgi:virginiamycin B lyase